MIEEYTEPVMLYQLPTSSSLMPSQSPSKAASGPNPHPVWLFSMNVMWYGMFLWLFGSAVLVLSFLSSLCIPSPSLAGRFEDLKYPWFCTALLSNS